MMIPVKIPLDHPVMITLGQDFSLLTIHQRKRLHQRKVMIRKHSRHLKLRIFLMIQHTLNPVVSGKPQKDVKMILCLSLRRRMIGLLVALLSQCGKRVLPVPPRVQEFFYWQGQTMQLMYETIAR